MATDRSKVTVDELKKVSQSLNIQKETIYNTYKTQVKSVLSSSNDFFQISGVDFSNIESSFDTTFNKVNTELESLINKLDATITSYAELTSVLQQLFNSDLASQLSNLLNI